MAFRKRLIYGLVFAGALAGLAAGLIAVLAGEPSTSAAVHRVPPASRAPVPRLAGSSSAPDLTALVAQLTSASAQTQQQALVPGGQAGPSQPLRLLPPGSTLQLEPATWQVTGVDSAGAAAAGRIGAHLTEPGRPVASVFLDVMKVGGRWLLYQTGPS
jgi:hypothetical protein